MQVIYNTSTDPHFNLAAEEYMLGGTGDIFMLWRNARSVIIGKNQNAYSEVNTDFTSRNNISVVRRLTGGGAVFHDLGNVNFTFITDAADNQEIDFAPFIRPITDALATMGVTACADGRNDIVADGCKISGNAQCVYETKDGRRRLLHHGTLLFCANLSFMQGALNVSEAKLKTKGIKSVRSRVANIASLPGYTGSGDPEAFVDRLLSYAADTYGKCRELTDAEKAGINSLADSKYRLWEWNFGRSPQHSAASSARFACGEVQISYTAKNGIIESANINGDFFGAAPLCELEERLAGCRLQRDELLCALKDCGKYISGSQPEELLSLLI